MNSHPLHTTIVDVMCDRCEKKRVATDKTMEKLKMAFKALNERVEKLKEEADNRVEKKEEEDREEWMEF